MSVEDDLRHKLERTQAELRMLYEISNAMRSTLKLDEIFYMILTAITCREGLGFNRAMLFLANEKKHMIDGVMAIGAASSEEASRVWAEMESKDLTLDELIYSFHEWDGKTDKPLNDLVRSVSLPLKEESGIVAQTCLEGMPFEITTSGLRKKLADPVLDRLNCNLFVSIPLYTRTKTLGTIVADNLFSGQEISRDDVRLLMMFGNQAGRAIDNSRVYEKTVVQAKTDSLSRLWNHATFQERADKAVKEAKRTGRNVSFLMMDIDHFKQYNDNAGHAAGDEVIRGVAAVLQVHTRPDDTAARYGGEEFAVILPRTSAGEAFEAAERIRQAVEERNFPKEENQPGGGLTVSIGVSTFPDNGKNKDTLLRKADMALYKAKQAGRDRTRAARR